MPQNNMVRRLFSVLKGQLGRAFVLAALALPQAVWAQVLDRIEVNRSGDEAEIVVRFLTQVQYQRHSPPARGDTIRIYFQLVGAQAEANLMREVKTSPANDAIGIVTAAYPDSNAAMTVKLPAVTSYRIRPATDGRSISIFVPALPPAAESSPVPTPTPPVAGATATTATTATSATTSAAAAASGTAAGATSAVAETAAAATAAAAPAAAPVPAETAKAAGNEPPPPTSAETEGKAKLFLTQAQNALEQNQPAPAIEALNNLLNLPPNSLSQQGQEMIGLARERAGEFGKAKAEYELYLKLYPKGEGSDRVRERLSRLPAATVAETTPAPSVRATEPTGWKLYGGFSQYRYHGESTTTTEPLRLSLAASSTTQTPEQLAAAQANVNQVSRSVQNTLVSNLDATEEHRSGTVDDRFVIRDVLNTNFQADTSLGQKKNDSRLTTAYYERSDRDRAYMFRLGRQSGTGGGVLGQFNGVSGSYNLNPQLRLSGVGGQMYEYGSPYSKQVFGATLDLQPSQSRQWGGNAFFVTQRYEGMTDRAALGGEMRYFDAGKSFFSTIEYDVAFRALNTLMMQANLQGASGTSYYVTADHRRSPVLLLTSAADAEQVSIKDLLTQISEKDLRADIKRMTPFSNSFAVGFTHPYSPRWQLGADYRVSNLSGTSDTVFLPSPRTAQPASGNTHSVSAQAIGNNLLWKNDMLVINAGYFYAKKTASPYTAESLTINHVAVPNEQWRFDSALRFYWQTSSPTSYEPLSTKQTRISPSFRVSYRLRNNWSFEAEGNIEYDRNSATSSSGDSRSTVKFIYSGYRWDWL
jgi:hypothetical protein